MAEDRIDSLFDPAAITKEFDALIKDITKRLKTFPSIRVNLDGSSTIKEFTAAARSAKIEQDALTKQTEQLKVKILQLTVAKKEQLLQYQKETAETRKLNQEKKQAERNAANEKKIAEQAANEYFNLGKALQDAELRYKNLALTQGFSNKQTQAALKEALAIRNVLDKVDQNLRNYQRNVGNYSSAFNGLGVSIQQILREAPSLAVSANTFFLAISNNLPILFDEINKIKDANRAAALAAREAATVAREQAVAQALAAGQTQKAAIAEGLLAEKTILANAAQAKTPSLLQLIGRNLFSVQSALTIGITLLTLYGAKFASFVSELFRGKAAVDQFAEQQKKIAQVLGESKDSFVNATLEVNNLKIAIDQAKRGIITKEEAVKLYNDTLGKTTGNVKSLEEAETDLIEKGDAYIRFTFLKAAANVALGESAKLVFEAEINARKKIDQLQQDQKNNPVVNADSLNQWDAYLIKIGEKDRAARRIRQRDAKTTEANTFKDIAAQFIKEAEELSKKYKFDFNSITEPKGGSKKSKSGDQKITDNTAEVLLREEFERQKIRLDRSIKTNKDIFEDEKQSYYNRLTALRSFTADQIRLIDLEREYAISSEKLRLQGVISGLEEQRKEKEANVKATNDQIAREVKAINDQIAREVEASNSIILTIEQRSKDRLLDVGAELNKGLQKLLDDRKKIQDQNQKIFEDRYEKSKSIFKKAIEELESAIDNINAKIVDARTKLFDELRDALFQFLADSITREEQYLDEQARLNEEQKTRRINQVNLLGLSEAERIRQTAIIEKQAAFESEKIEKRKRQLAVERAKFEKAANVLNIITSTARAVMDAYKDDGITPLALRVTLASLIASVGAVQLAKAISAPLPRYKTGRGKGKDELAITGDGGVPEYILRDSGKVDVTPSKPTLTYLGKSDMVFKDKSAFVKHMIDAANPYSQIMQRRERSRNDYMTESTGQAIVKELRNIDPSVRIFQTISAPIESTMSWQKAFR